MKRIGRQLMRLRIRLAGMSPRAGVAAALLAAAVLAGAAWLAMGGGGGETVSVFPQRMEVRELSASAAALRAGGIECQVQSGKLWVSRKALPQARAILAGRQGDDQAASFLEKMAQGGDMWSTADQQARRWQAARMATLSKLISMFPAVQSATVLYEGGSAGGLGRPPVEPTACVNVCLKPQAQMTPELVSAIADQVASSIAGMRRQDVRIVDSAGLSYRAMDEDPSVQRSFQALRSAENYYEQKIRAALQYIRGPAVGVRLSGEGANCKCVGVSVSVPLSYLSAVSGLTPGQQLSPQQTQTAFAPQLAKVQRAAAVVAGLQDLTAVSVDWYYDMPPGEASAVAGAAGKSSLARDIASALRGRMDKVMACGALMLAGLLAAGLAVARRRFAQVGPAEPAGAEGAQQALAPARRLAAPMGLEGIAADAPFAFLQDLQREEIVALIEDEHPQTVALVLAHLSPGGAAAVLAALPPARQVEVVRRVAELGPVEVQVLQEVQRDLALRLAEAGGEQAAKVGGIAKIAEILHHAGYATEKKVLDGLSSRQPDLADSIRNRMFVFEDIIRMPDALLRAALEVLESEELAIALRTAGEDVRKKVLANLAAATAREVREEMDRIGPVRISDVEASQQRVMEAIRRAERGEYVVAAQENPSEVTA